ncbi:MAG: tetratricopeptide repeat protein, partial [Smithella sp.]
IFEGLHDVAAQGKVLNNIGLISARNGKYEEALESFHKALYLFKDTDNKLGVADQLGNISSVYRDIKQYDNALSICQDAMKIYKEINHKPGIGDQYSNIAYLLVMKGDLSNALDLYKSAIPFYDDAGEEEKASLTKENIENLEKNGVI